jgi:hypothetical protein
LSEQHKILKEKSIFLVNNYDLILSVFHDRRIVSEETIKFEKLLGEQREKFVEEELMTHFGKMITFVRQYEPLILAKATGHGGNHHHHHHQNPMTGININTSTNSMTTTTTTSNNNNNNNNNSSSTEVDIAMVERVVKEFAATWKSGIEKMNGNIMKYFSNFRNGTEILKQVLTQLLLYYTRFVEIIKKSWTHPPAFGNEIVTTQEILYEIKKYSRSF